MKKKDIELAMLHSMKSFHWEFKSVCQLPKAYLREVPITPVYVPDVVRRSETVYLISGYVGLVSQKFEMAYASCSTLVDVVPRSRPRFCLGLDIANFDVLRSLRYIEQGLWDRKVIEFCTILAELLEKFPHDSEALKGIFRQRKLVGVELDKFVPYGQHLKFAAMESFITKSVTGM